MFLSKTQIIAALCAVLLALVVLELVRRRKLAEDYSFLWIISTVAIAVFGFSTPLLRGMTRTLGIMYESSLVFAAGVGFGIVMLLFLSVRLSKLGRHLDDAAREIALLRLELEEVRAAAATPDRPTPEGA
jgi:hypothetical protein